jgi:RNA polymerase sigma-70 factor (ECF subfamily)
LGGNNTKDGGVAAETSSSLLIRIRDPRDSDSWATFLQVYTPIVYRFALARGLQQADAADVTQETLLDVVRSIRNFDYRPEQGRFRDWLAVVVRRRLIKFWQRTKVNDSLMAEPVGAGIDSEWIDTFQNELLEVVLARVQATVEPHVWAAFEQTWRAGRSAADVSRDLKMPIDLVYSAKSRVLKRLEREVRELGDDCGWIQ